MSHAQHGLAFTDDYMALGLSELSDQFAFYITFRPEDEPYHEVFRYVLFFKLLFSFCFQFLSLVKLKFLMVFVFLDLCCKVFCSVLELVDTSGE